jgi:4-hydroxy-tetrahydrodipicolinate reductase
MGKSIEQIALERGHEILLKVDKENADNFDIQQLSACDVAIEFSRPESAVQNIRKCLEASIPVVVGTTGWYDQYGKITEEVKQAKTALLAATNFSVGVNLFFALNKKLAELMSDQTEYEASMVEIHHLQKLDSPSGTAITLAEGLIEKHAAYQKWVNKESQEKGTLPIISEREADVPGTHIVNYESEIDSIEIKHTAKSRKGFALGAVLAAEFIKDKEGVYEMKDLLKI